MAIIRLYTGDDGQTHMEELDPASHPSLTTMQATEGIVFRVSETGRFSDWHNAPSLSLLIPENIVFGRPTPPVSPAATARAP